MKHIPFLLSQPLPEAIFILQVRVPNVVLVKHLGPVVQKPIAKIFSWPNIEHKNVAMNFPPLISTSMSKNNINDKLFLCLSYAKPDTSLLILQNEWTKSSGDVVYML